LFFLLFFLDPTYNIFKVHEQFITGSSHFCPGSGEKNSPFFLLTGLPFWGTLAVIPPFHGFVRFTDWSVGKEGPSG
jgi:hypothetical protein